MRRWGLSCLVIATLWPAAASAGWSAIDSPPHTKIFTVSCVSRRACVGIGYAIRPPRGRSAALPPSARWDGRSWTLGAPFVAPKGAALYSISCRTATSCVAAGQLFPRESLPVAGLIERFDGRRWRREAVPTLQSPLGFKRRVNLRLYGAACPSARVCFAVGNADPNGTGGSPGVPVALRRTGSRWELMRLPAPVPSGSLRSISCRSATACLATGDVGGVLAWDGRRWSVLALATARPSALELAACPTSGLCVGVDGNGATFRAARAGSTWTITTGPAGPGDGIGDGTQFDGISCANSSFCAAVHGDLGAVWDGTSWTTTHGLLHGFHHLTSVSCPVAGWCMAAGDAGVVRYAR